VEDPFFGLLARREYRYDQIHRVRETQFSVLRIPVRYVIIDYVEADRTARSDKRHSNSKRLMLVKDHTALFKSLRARARGKGRVSAAFPGADSRDQGVLSAERSSSVAWIVLLAFVLIPPFLVLSGVMAVQSQGLLAWLGGGLLLVSVFMLSL
jgi:hypothetical protein